MAKGQKRSNKEIRKPKADKAPAAPATAIMSRGKLDPISAPKKKG